MQELLPEGGLINTERNERLTGSLAGLREAMREGATLEGAALRASSELEVSVRLGGLTGRIPRDETALGMREGRAREIGVLSRIGKPVCFKVLSAEEGEVLLSRRAAQAEALSRILWDWRPGDVIPATVTHLEEFGAFVDVARGLPSMLPTEYMAYSRTGSAAERFTEGQRIPVLLRSVDRQLARVELSHRELLGTWEENAALFSPGDTVLGTVRGLRPYGVFVEIAPNLTGLAEPDGELRQGERVSVYIKSIAPEKMKVKLVVISRLEPGAPPPLRYFIREGHIARWRYSPESCERLIESAFEG